MYPAMQWINMVSKYKTKTWCELLPRSNKTLATLVLITAKEVLSLIQLHKEPMRCSCKWSPLTLETSTDALSGVLQWLPTKVWRSTSTESLIQQ